MERIKLAGEGGQSKRTRKNSNQGVAFETNNEADGRPIIILDNKKYFYEKCNRLIKNVIGNRHAKINWDQSIRRDRLIHGDQELNGLDQTRNKRIKEISAKHEVSSRFDRVPEYTMKKEVKEEKRKGKYNKLHEKNIKVDEKNSDDDTSTEVEILVSDDDTSTEVEIQDSDDVIKRGISSAFVPSTIYASVGSSKASSNYRKRVLNVLEKPFDMTEYRTLTEEVKSYLSIYPDLKDKLEENKHKRPTRMTILRGFFYWLQNVMHDEAFQPWKDSQCLGVLPGSVPEN